MAYELITLALLRLRGVGPRTVQTMWQKHPSMGGRQDVVDALRGSGGSKVPPDSLEMALDGAFDDAERILNECNQKGIKVLAPGGLHFPQRLTRIPNAPLLLFAQGNVSILRKDSVAVIGTREPTGYGIKSGRRIARTLALEGWVVVSGLAEGCDTAGHEGCLDGEGHTVAVLAHGFGRIYPASNKNLAQRILEKEGCLVTEYPPGQPPSRSSFVERDRLQSGISVGIIVIETDVKGGTMHTVRHATEQGRGIAAIVHPENLRMEPKTQGNALLIAEKRAVPLKDKDDVTRFVNSLRQDDQTVTTVSRDSCDNEPPRLNL